MNLLFALLRNINSTFHQRLESLSPRGSVGQVWALINEQAARGEFDKKGILDKTGISSSHLDKITSELLAKCYTLLFEDDTYELLNFLSSRVSLIKQFYNEMTRQLKYNARTGTNEDQAKFIRQCFQMVHTNMPMIYRDSKVSKRLAKLYVSLYTGPSKREADFYMQSVLLLEKMETAFAAGDIKEQANLITKEFEAIGSPSLDYSKDALFQYYWAQIYFHYSLENHTSALNIAHEALDVLSKHKDTDKVHLLRLKLKANELLYYMSRFEEAFNKYKNTIYSPVIKALPDRLYHETKFIQLCLITGHLEEAGRMIATNLATMNNRVEELIMPRDIVTYVKYCLFRNDFETAFRFIQIGFEKNPKGKYFQYEIELRNLQTAYFFLTGQEDISLDMCRKHIKFLRNHGYTATNNDFPYFYILVKAIFEEKLKHTFSARHQKMFEHYQKGSYAVYGRLLAKMRNS
jgi:hypothetical protein